MSPEEKTDKYLKEIQIKTGCSLEFLQQARPNIVKLFQDVDGETLDKCLMDISEIIKSQADLEKINKETKVKLKALKESEEKLQESFNGLINVTKELNKELKATKTLMQYRGSKKLEA